MVSIRKFDDVLGQIFGSKDVSRTVAKSASGQAGLDPALLEKMLPIVAMLVAGYMAKKSGGQAAQRVGGGSPRCSTPTATAIPSTTSSTWREKE